MSSYWGHGDRGEQAKERKRSFRSRPAAWNRRASLPCTSQLEAMRLKHPLTPSLEKSHEDKKDMWSHAHARRVSSDEYRGSRSGGAENHSHTIPELTESFKKMLRFHNHRVPSLDSANVCLICSEEMRRKGNETGQGGHELPCPHRFQNKKTGRLEQGARPRSRSSAAVCESRKEVPFCGEQEEYGLPRQHRSPRRQR